MCRLIELLKRCPPEVGEAINRSFDHIFNILLNRMDTSKFVRFVELADSPDFLMRHEQHILGFLDSLIADQSPNTQMIDGLFGSLGRGRYDFPDSFDDFEMLPPFWQFVVQHRAYIAARIDQNSDLLHLQYQFMFHAQCLLSFSTRFRSFRNSMSRKASFQRFSLTVRRAHVLEDSFNQLSIVSPQTWLRRWSVKFENAFEDEPAIDQGGPFREWFSLVTQDLFNMDYALFCKTLGGYRYQPNALSSVNHHHLEYFGFAGRFFAFALINQVYLSAHLSIPFLKQLLGQSLSLSDLEDIDAEVYRTMKWILDHSLREMSIEMMFVANEDYLGARKQITLKENGEAIAVTDENKEEFVALTVEHRLRRSTSEQTKAFCDGFWSLVDQNELKFFGAHELDLLLCGEDTIDVEDWQNNCQYRGTYSPTHPIIRLFFRTLGKWPQTALAKLIKFITGCPRIPLGGFAAFENPILIVPASKDHLITAHTCVNTLDLPQYETEEEMNDRLLYAVNNCTEFGCT
jgi:E3 ubiquitin-protein ligase HUWE1